MSPLLLCVASMLVNRVQHRPQKLRDALDDTWVKAT